MSSSSESLPLPLGHYQRYGRQMILEGFGLAGQVKLQQGSVVVVGAGGLGCPVLQYLGAAGVGKICIIDDDQVELSNLQRQVLHTESSVGLNKAQSAAESLKRINSSISIEVVPERLTSKNALSILGSYDIILDCSDNPPTRYLLSDAAVVLQKPLVSGAAQKYEGQLCIYNLGLDGPCYRCLFPKPPAPEMAASCEETGILGVVTGIIGNLQALETIKLITGLHDGNPSMLLFSALSSPPFRSIKLRSRKSNCAACGTKNFSLKTMPDIDYVQLCGGPRPDWIQRGLEAGATGQRIPVKELKRILDSGQDINFLDVRTPTEFGICHLPHSRNTPLHDFVANPEKYLPPDPHTPTYIICRLGNDSQIAADVLRGLTQDGAVADIIGGLKAWSNEIDSNFPVY